MLVVVALVALCYCGGNYCPTVLKQNKEMLLGGAIALVLSSFFGMRLEGYLDENLGAMGEWNRAADRQAARAGPTLRELPLGGGK